MHAPIGGLLEAAAPIDRQCDRLISIPFLLLRAATAGGALATGFVQTFVFARILSPELFSVFIVVGAVGYTLWLAELGLPSVLFVNLRVQHLARRRDAATAHQATALIVFYAAGAIAAAAICFIVALARPDATLTLASELALFLSSIALNLPWTALRSISIAVDLFVFFESLELIRRTAVVAALLAMLAGLPLAVYLIAANLLWAVLFATAAGRLIGRGALSRQWRGAPRQLVTFLRTNRRATARSSLGALSNGFLLLFPYYLVPALFGLGAAPIVLEVTFRIFRGGCGIFAAICDLAVPGQTRALAARDGDRLIRTTLAVMALCCVPAAIACGLLIFAGGPLFSYLLRTAATVPPAVVPILTVLLLAGVLQTVAEALLQYTGYFRSLAFTGIAVAAGALGATAFAFLAGLGLVGFLAAYAAVYAVGAIALAVAAWRGPIRAAQQAAS